MRSRRVSRRRRSFETGEIDETRVFQRSDVRRRRSYSRAAALVIGALLLFLVGAAFGFYRYATSPSKTLIPPEYQEVWEGRINILVLGIDGGVNGRLKNPLADQNGTRSDVMMLVSFDPDTKEVGILSIPRDTRVYIPDVVFDYEKVTHAHAYGGPALAVKTVEGFLDVPVHHYARMDFEGFKKAVDLLGGVDVDVPEDMDYDDPYQNLHIHLKKGPQHLNGDQALGLVRYRDYDNGDIGRIRVQEVFLKALIKKAASLSSALRIPDLLRTMAPYVKTDLSTQDILNLGNMALGVKPEESVRMAIVPGSAQDINDGGQVLNYWIADRTATDDLVNDLIRGISKEKNATVRVAIENGNGVSGAADALATVLRAEGFNVVSVGNASKQDYAETRVIAKTEKAAARWIVLRSLKAYCPQTKTYNGNVPSGADVLIIVGRDYKLPFGS